MANFFDQFDVAPGSVPSPSAAGNFFDQFDAPTIGAGEDIAKTAIPSVGRMVSETAGLPGDVGSLISAGADKLYNLVSPPQKTTSDLITGAEPQGGIPQSVKTAIKTAVSGLPVIGALATGPTSQQVQSVVTPVTGDYQPQTTGGKVFDTAVRFAPAVVGGPEALAVKVGTRVLAPAAASEAAGQLAEGTAAEPYVKPAAAIAAAVAAHRLTTPSAIAQAVPEVQQIRNAATAGYQHPEVAAVQIRPNAVGRLADQIERDLNQRGQLNIPESAGATHQVVDRIRNPNLGNTPGLLQGAVSVEELRANRSALSGMAAEVNANGRPTTNAVAAGHAVRRIDAFLDGLQQPDLVAGNAQRAATILRQANADWAAASKAEDIGTRLTRAERQAAKSGSGSNIDNAIRQKVSAVLDVPSRTVGLRPAEIAQAERVVRGSPTGNLLRKFGKLGFGDGLSLLLHAGATLPTGGANIPVGIAGTAARKLAERMTQREAAQLEEMIRARSTEAARWRAIHARTAGILPPTLGAGPVGLLSGIPASSQLRAGILPYDQQLLPVEQLR